MGKPYQQRDKRCRTCRWWRPKGPDDKAFLPGATMGWCKRYPPQIVFDGEKAGDTQPYVAASDYCGEWSSS